MPNAVRYRTLCFLIVWFPVASANAGSALAWDSQQDSTRADSSYLASYRGLYDRAWSEKFMELWNSRKDTARVLAGMGKVRFVSLARDTISALFEFDSAGQARLLDIAKSIPADSIPAFTALLERWADFMEGKFGAIVGVVAGKIRYKGPATLAFKYGRAFDSVAPVGRRVTRIVSRPKRKR